MAVPTRFLSSSSTPAKARPGPPHSRIWPPISAEYFDRAQAMMERFHAGKQKAKQARGNEKPPAILELERLHTEFKNLPYPEVAAGFQWCVSEAMRHDIEALENSDDLAMSASHERLAAGYWERVTGQTDVS